MATTTKYFYEYGFNDIVNDKAIQNFCGDIILKYNSANRPILLLKLKKGETEFNNWLMEKKIENGYNIIFYINEAGNYDLDIKANIDHSNSYIGIVNFKITCNSTPDEKNYFQNLLHIIKMMII